MTPSVNLDISAFRDAKFLEAQILCFSYFQLFQDVTQDGFADFDNRLKISLLTSHPILFP